MTEIPIEAHYVGLESRLIIWNNWSIIIGEGERLMLNLCCYACKFGTLGYMILSCYMLRRSIEPFIISVVCAVTIV